MTGTPEPLHDCLHQVVTSVKNLSNVNHACEDMDDRIKYTKWLAREAQLSQKHEEMYVFNSNSLNF